MIREIYTLQIDGLPVQYYIRFNKDRLRFYFQASLKNKTAPSFVIVIENDEYKVEPGIDEKIREQALQKVEEIVNDKIFDSL